jgi:hypothetical protein
LATPLRLRLFGDLLTAKSPKNAKRREQEGVTRAALLASAHAMTLQLIVATLRSLAFLDVCGA